MSIDGAIDLKGLSSLGGQFGVPKINGGSTPAEALPAKTAAQWQGLSGVDDERSIGARIAVILAICRDRTGAARDRPAGGSDAGHSRRRPVTFPAYDAYPGIARVCIDRRRIRAGQPAIQPSSWSA